MSQVIEIKNSSLLRRIISFVIDYIMLLPLVLVLYPLWKDKLFGGQSIGNKIVGIELIDFKTGKKPSFFKVLVKNIIFIITLSLGSLFLFFNDGRRGLGDIICSTYLIRKPKAK